MPYQEITKPSLPTLNWDDPLNFWDEEDLSWDLSGYGDIDKPVMKNFLLIQDGGFLLFQDGSQINIGGQNYNEIEKPVGGIYTEIIKPT